MNDVQQLREVVGKILLPFVAPMQSDDITELASAMVTFQYSLMGAKKDSSNPYFKSKYADLQSCQDAIREPLHANGLAITQTTRLTDNGAVLVTTLMHSSGQWIKGELPLSASKQNDPQAQGSAITYARRYALCAITGLYQTDDDAEAAQGRKQDPPKQSNQSRSTTGSAPSATGKTATTTNTANAATGAAGQADSPKQNAPTAAQSPATAAGSAGNHATTTPSTAPATGTTEPLSKADLDALLAAGENNGWNKKEISNFVCYAFKVPTPKEIVTKVTKKQAQMMAKLIAMPQNAGNKVTVALDGNPASSAQSWPQAS